EAGGQGDRLGVARLPPLPMECEHADEQQGEGEQAEHLAGGEADGEEEAEAGERAGEHGAQVPPARAGPGVDLAETGEGVKPEPDGQDTDRGVEEGEGGHGLVSSCRGGCNLQLSVYTGGVVAPCNRIPDFLPAGGGLS